ncbi:MAG TPA: class I SAM-dependent methyltransferase [Candidatus Diapherotrites archaeon]|uniref:Class I SAM-dependent methyltransferase n=1 Tax=Candidatus Iainarchaeum sp. TaxID=3101447 RepID=A0A7J4JM92_9ARCH|nr:class I SAM-dependent methyltransferase [Candidatus Diapherotrites archaeon]HIH17017.1 class I SAM-dependent methyltransferase [Candidatus Diapherotrites archaeon]
MSEEIVVNPGIRHYLFLELGTLYWELRKAVEGHVKGRNLLVLDIGCGWKKYQPFFEGKARKVIGLEPGENGLPDVRGRGESLPFKPASFDVVLCTQVLQYFDDPFHAAREMHRVLKKNGVAFVSAPGTYPLFDPPNPKWRFMPHGFQRLFAGFSSVEVRPLGGFIQCYFQILALLAKHAVFGRRPWENWFTKRVMWFLAFPFLNVLGKTLDAWFYNDKASIGYLAIAKKG